MMRIELLKTTPDRAGRYTVQFDNGRVLRLYRQTVEDFSLYSGMELSQEQFDQIIKSAESLSAKMRAVRIVSAANVSKKDLENRLVQKGEEAADAKEAVDWLKELHLLDDGETARQLVASAAAKGYGKSRIKNILYEKGIPQEFWDDALADLPEMDDAIDRFLARRWQGKDPDDKEVKRTVDALIRRGHSWKDIQAGLRRYRADLELEENTEDYIP